MKAVILLRTNPGFEETASGHLERVSVPGVEVTETLHLFGRFDGLVKCEAENHKSLGALGEALRRGGVFHTETLISIED
jgi:uncharacterized protein with GYD domain